MNENTNPDIPLTKDAPQGYLPEDQLKKSSPLSQSTDANSVEASSHNILNDSDTSNETLGNEDITSMDSLFDINDASEDTSHDDIAQEGGIFDEANLTQNHTDTSDELALGKIPVEITVELGSFIIDAANSESLSAGDVLTLNTVCPGQVRLMCDDAEVGRGELVDINGQLGVQIVHNWSR